MQHVELHFIKNTPEDLRLAALAGLIDADEINTCHLCDKQLVYVYVLINEDQSITTCDSCLKVALTKVMM